MKIKLAIIDDEVLIREGLDIMLNSFEDITVIGTGKSGQEAVELCKTHEVDVILMDIRMPEVNGIEGTKRIKQLFPDIKILILTTFRDLSYIQEAMNEGASGYLLKDSSHHDIYHGIKVAYSGNIVMHSEISQQVFQGFPEAEKKLQNDSDLFKQLQLSEKDLQLIRLVARGYSNKEIAQELFLSEGTVKNNVSDLLGKLHLRDRTQLAIFAFTHHLTEEN